MLNLILSSGELGGFPLLLINAQKFHWFLWLLYALVASVPNLDIHPVTSLWTSAALAAESKQRMWKLTKKPPLDNTGRAFNQSEKRTPINDCRRFCSKCLLIQLCNHLGCFERWLLDATVRVKAWISPFYVGPVRSVPVAVAGGATISTFQVWWTTHGLLMFVTK